MSRFPVPLAYPILVGQLAAAGPGLLVDPYLKLADLHTIVVSTQRTRLLVSGKTNNRGEVGAILACLGKGSLSRRVEVRSSTGLHAVSSWRTMVTCSRSAHR